MGILRSRFLRVAEVQDLIIIELSRKFDFILHGGAAVWRVYGGKRFSFDLDIYHAKPTEIIDYFKDIKSLKLTKYKITRSNIAYLKVGDLEEVEVEVAPFFRSIESIEMEYWLTDGTSLVIKTLSPEDLVREKINAFIDRGKSRDLYDIYYLLDFCEVDRIKDELRKLLPRLNSKPKDFEGLNELILIGKTPSFESIRLKVMRYAKN